MNPQDTTAKIESLTQRRLRGQRAETQREALDGLFSERQGAYLRELVSKTRLGGQVSEGEVWKLVALDDVMTDFEKLVRRGREAARKLDKLQEAGGGN